MSRQQRTMNIGGDPNDTSYRYKMAPLQTKVEGRGNGIKTILLNITTVSEHLRTEPSYTTKFFGIEFAAQSNFDKQRMVGIVNGKHQKQDLQSKLNKYINEFILCKKCKLPELKWRIIKKKQLLQKCKACSWSGPNASNHRVRAYIINHPPKTKKTQNKPSNKKPKIKENKDISSEEKEVEWRDDEVWSVDTSLDAIAQQRHDEMRRLAQKNDINIGINAEEKKESRSAAKTLRNYVDCQERSYLEILDEIKRISLAHKCDQKKKIQITIDALCKLDTLDGFITSLRKYKVIFSTFASNEDDAKIFFGVLEEFICRRNPDEFLGKVYKILECLYDEEIVNEDDMLLWMDLPTDKAIIVDQDEAEVIRNKAAPFIKWLRENEEDEEDMKDGEDDVEEEGEEEDIC